MESVLTTLNKNFVHLQSYEKIIRFISWNFLCRKPYGR